ncbi:MAG: caspase family protein [Deltaproteobacteria bacterium]|nr:caspase family protein [Deltaproteobacteria bacterium]
MSATALLLLLQNPAPPSESFAVVVSNTNSLDGSLPKLEYADDDGARWYELLALTSKKVTILTVLDPSSQRLFPEIAEIARVPTRKELLGALDSTFSEIEAARGRGVRTTFYFVFAGHGSIGDDGEGYVHLVGERFTRSDLFQHVVSRSPATVNHIIVDACNAYFMVKSRGGADEDAALLEFLGREDPDRYPGTGFLVSTSKAAEVHEWSRFASGVFSHEVRSALAGAADVNGDARVSYEEVQAFVAAANRNVSDPRARLAIFAHAPRLHLEEPLFDRSLAANAPTLLIPATLAGRSWLEDARGVRFLDMNASDDSEVSVTLVPSSTYYLRTAESEVRIPIVGSSRAVATRFPRSKPTTVARGSEESIFQKGLFAVPFGPAFFDGYRTSRELELIDEPTRSSPWKPIVALAASGAAMVALTGGIVAGINAADDAEAYRSTIGSDADVSPFKVSSESNARLANILFATAATLAATSLVTWLWPD